MAFPMRFDRAAARGRASRGICTRALANACQVMIYAPITDRINFISRPSARRDQAVRVPRAKRVPAIDAARGTAMVLVCLAHFASKYILPAGGDAPGTWLPFVGHIASPMFFVISGSMVGYLFATHPETFGRVRATLAKRAVFFLTAGHLLILGAHARSLNDLTGSARMLFVTDTIALALLLSPRLLRIPPRVRLAGAVAVYAASCALVYLSEPHGLAWRIVKDTFVGIDGDGFWEYNVPVLPWLAVHAAATVLGPRLAEPLSRTGRMRIEQLLASVGCAVVAMGAVVRLFCLFLVDHVMAPGGRAAFVARQLASPWQRVPPSPVHLLLFSGLALLGISVVFALERRGVLASLLAWLTVLGKTSAFVFILQFYVFYVIVPALVPLSLTMAPFVFFAAMLAIGEAARIWLHRRSKFTRPSWFIGATPVIPVPET